MGFKTIITLCNYLSMTYNPHQTQPHLGLKSIWLMYEIIRENVNKEIEGGKKGKHGKLGGKFMHSETWVLINYYG